MLLLLPTNFTYVRMFQFNIGWKILYLFNYVHSYDRHAQVEDKTIIRLSQTSFVTC